MTAPADGTDDDGTVPVVIYGAADIASALDVSRSTFSNYLARYVETPSPSYETPNGRAYWDADGLDEWRLWAGLTS